MRLTSRCSHSHFAAQLMRGVRGLAKINHENEKDMSTYSNFMRALYEIETLPIVYEVMARMTDASIRQIDDGLDVREYRSFFPKAGIILAVTAWEAYIEDKLEDAFYSKVDTTFGPEDLSHVFNRVGEWWLMRKPKPPDLVAWAGDGWKDILRERFDEEISGLNTPGSKNLISLSEHYFDIDITANWIWDDMTQGEVCAKLDEIISVRGEIVHGKNREDVPLSVLTEYLDFLKKLCGCVESNEALW